MMESYAGVYPHRRTLLLVFAHPDDESFGTGGTVARAAAGGWRVQLLCATRGEAGRISPAAGLPGRLDLGGVRERELREAAAILGIEEVHFLPYRDGSLAAVHAHEGIAHVRTRIQKVRPDVVVTFCPDDGITGHPDHRAVGAWATTAFFAIYGEGGLPADARLYWVAVPKETFSVPAHAMMDPTVPRGTPLADISTRVDVFGVIDAKRRAILAHETQRDGIGAGDFLEPEFGREYFRRVVPPWKPGDAAEDWIWHNESNEHIARGAEQDAIGSSR